MCETNSGLQGEHRDSLWETMLRDKRKPRPADWASETERQTENSLGGFQSVNHLSPFRSDSRLISVLKERTNVFPDITILEKASSNNLTAIKYQICCINISWILN